MSMEKFPAGTTVGRMPVMVGCPASIRCCFGAQFFWQVFAARDDRSVCDASERGHFICGADTFSTAVPACVASFSSCRFCAFIVMTPLFAQRVRKRWFSCSVSQSHGHYICRVKVPCSDGL